MTDQTTQQTIAVIGGTGKEGAGLAYRWAYQGYRIIVGSRDAGRAQEKAAEINAELGLSGDRAVLGMANRDAAQAADLVVIDVTVPINPVDFRAVMVPPGKAASLEAAAILGPGVRVVAAFQNVSAVHLKKVEHAVDCDVLVCGDDDAAKTAVMALVEAAGMRGVDAGPLANAVAAESLTPALLYINKRYKVKGAGIRITGL